MRRRKTGIHVKNSMGDRVFMAIDHLIMLLLLIVILYPLYFVVLASVTDPAIVNAGKLILKPMGFYTEGYEAAFQYKPLWKGYANTILYTVVGASMSTACTVTAGYVMSRKDLFGRKVLMGLFTFTMYFGGGLVPSFLVIKGLGMYDTMWALVLPSAISVYNMIVCKTFFQQNIPGELLEAARIDGANDFTFFFRIVIPLSSTIIAVMALFFATGRWNAYFDSMVYMRSSDKMPLQIVLRNLLLLDSGTTELFNDPESIASQQRRQQQMKYCVIVLSAAPLLVVYPFLQRFFVKGMLIGSIKE